MPNSTSALAGRLASHYLVCVEAGDRRSLLLRDVDRNKRFVAPWTEAEDLLHLGKESCGLVPRNDAERSYMAQGTASASGPDAGFYGYPLRFDGRGRLAPLFVVPVTSERVDATVPPSYRLTRSGDLLLNRYLFVGYTDDELDAVQRDLELNDEYGTFAARLEAALAYFDRTPLDPASGTTEPFPRDTGARWVETPVFLRDVRGPFTYNLRQDLSAMAKYDVVKDAAPNTSMATLWGGGGQTAESQELAELRPLNDSQRRAARSALEESLTVVTGPPGTGKSQVVVDILASSILSGRPVLFASKNNQAVDVVRARLRKALGEPLDFSLRTGSRTDMQKLGPEILDRLAHLRDTGPPGGEDEARRDIDRARASLEELKRLRESAQEALNAEEIAEGEVAVAWRRVTPNRTRPTLDLAELASLLDDARAYAGEAPMGFVRWLKRLFRGSATRRELAERTVAAAATSPSAIGEEIAVLLATEDGFSPVVSSVRDLISYRGWAGARSTREDADDALSTSFQRSDTYEGEVTLLQEDASEATVRLCRAVWGRRLVSAGDAVRKSIEVYLDALDNVGGRGAAYAPSLTAVTAAMDRVATYLPIWITTALSVRNAVPLRPGVFDLVVIDEASQCDVASAIPLLYRAKRAAVIGDPHQLQHIPSIDAAVEESLPTGTDLVPTWSYAKRSLFAVAADAYKTRTGREPLFLEEHYRSHPDIIEFSNGQFYGGELKVRTDLEAMALRLPGLDLGLFWSDVVGRVPASSRSAYNDIEIAAVVDYVGGLLDHVGDRTTIGIVTPFRAQKDKLERAVYRAPWFEANAHRVGVGTAYTFQGDERDVIVFSPVVAEGMRPGTRAWAATTEPLLNVAVTRARAGFHVVGDLAGCQAAGGPLSVLAARAQLVSSGAAPHA